MQAFPVVTDTEKELEMHILKRLGTRGGFVVALVLAALLAACGAPSPSVQGTCNPSAAASAPSVPLGTPVENAPSATEWPSPNQTLYNTRVAHSTLASPHV